ncbi:MAG: flagellar export protein FliJ [Candidatus Sericytochromatia bacterium]|nr:flagellar export protein FliJ [Candidatus Sericytochromatia bacterium]
MPKAYRFPLEGLLRLRQRREDSAEQEMRIKEAAMREAEAQLALVLEQRAQSLHEAARRREGILDLESILQEHGWGQNLDQREEAARSSLQQAETTAAHAREEWLDARRQREMVERLKSKQQLAWLKGIELAEQRLLDELATQSHARRGKDTLGL